MGVSTAGSVAQRLRAAGRPADEPVAIVHRAGHPDQACVQTTLGVIARDGSPLPSPSVLVVGLVAERAMGGLAERLGASDAVACKGWT